jgi:hypothetical protein
LKKVEGSLETFPDTGCDECNGKIELTLHDKSKGVDVTYRFRLPEDFFQTINTRSQYDSGSNQRGWVDYSHTRPIVAMVAGEQLVFRMNMTIDAASKKGG